jgi:hypothetical protein
MPKFEVRIEIRKEADLVVEASDFESAKRIIEDQITRNHQAKAVTPWRLMFVEAKWATEQVEAGG